MYKNLRFKQIISSKYTAHLKTTLFQKSLKNSGLLLIFEFNIFSFLIDIIYNINESSVLRDQNSHQWQYSIFVTWYRRRHVNMILHCQSLRQRVNSFVKIFIVKQFKNSAHKILILSRIEKMGWVVLFCVTRLDFF